jgi:hypothetical protein
MEDALTSAETLKFRVKKQMASRRIVDLSTVQDERNRAIKHNQSRETEASNYLVLETR